MNENQPIPRSKISLKWLLAGDVRQVFFKNGYFTLKYWTCFKFFTTHFCFANESLMGRCCCESFIPAPFLSLLLLVVFLNGLHLIHAEVAELCTSTHNNSVFQPLWFLQPASHTSYEWMPPPDPPRGPVSNDVALISPVPPGVCQSQPWNKVGRRKRKKKETKTISSSGRRGQNGLFQEEQDAAPAPPQKVVVLIV